MADAIQKLVFLFIWKIAVLAVCFINIIQLIISSGLVGIAIGKFIAEKMKGRCCFQDISDSFAETIQG